MKKISLLVGLFFSLNLLSQTYFPFPTSSDSAIWNSVGYQFPAFPLPSTSSSTYYGLYGDTIIDGLTYSKFYGNWTGTESAFNITTANYLGSYREDTLKKVWCRYPNDSIDILKYDFGLNLGDTFCFYPYSQPCGYYCFPVLLVDSILVSGSYRRQIHLGYSAGQKDVWIEGIGSIVGTWDEPWCFVGNFEYSLDCYIENSIQVYGACAYGTGITEESKKENNFKLIKNPIVSTLEFDFFTKKSNQQFYCCIYSAIGKQIYKSTCVEGKSSIDVSTFKNGIYFVSIENINGVIISSKFIKMD